MQGRKSAVGFMQWGEGGKREGVKRKTRPKNTHSTRAAYVIEAMRLAYDCGKMPLSQKLDARALGAAH